jgi:nucleoside-diphosphate-sugar epimerase
MASPGYSSIALIGSGGIGKYFVDVLAAAPAHVSFIVITRLGSTTTTTLPEGSNGQIIPADLSSVSSIASILAEHKIEAVISTLGMAGIPQSQKVAIDAAKEAGCVKVFVLSEFGFSSKGASEGLLGLKEEHAKYCETIGMPYVRVYVSFPDPICN